MGGEGLCAQAAWPEYDEAKTVDATIEVAVQINGKLRATVILDKDASREAALAAAKAEPRIQAMLEGKTVVKEIVVPGKIVNLVLR